MLSRLVITFLQRSKRLLISWLQSPSAVIWEPRKIKSDTVSAISPSTCHAVMGPDAMIFVFWMLSFKPPFSLSSFTFIKGFFSSSSLMQVMSFVYLWVSVASSVKWNEVKVVSNSLWPHGLQLARPPCPSQLPEFTQTHFQWVSDAIESSHPLSSPSSFTVPSLHCK